MEKWPACSAISERREERIGDNILDEMRRVLDKAWELLGKAEAEGDHRASIVALREVRECLESLGEMLAKAEGPRRSQLTLAQRIEAARRRVAQHEASEIVVRFVKPDGQSRNVP